MFIIPAEASHSESSGLVRERRCRPCAVSPTFQSLTHSLIHFLSVQQSPVLNSAIVQPCLSLSLSACQSLTDSSVYSADTSSVCRGVCHSASSRRSIHPSVPPAVRPLGWWTSCGLRKPEMSEGRSRLSASGSRVQKTLTHTSFPFTQQPSSLPSCLAWLYYDRWSIVRHRPDFPADVSPRLWTSQCVWRWGVNMTVWIYIYKCSTNEGCTRAYRRRRMSGNGQKMRRRQSRMRPGERNHKYWWQLSRRRWGKEFISEVGVEEKQKKKEPPRWWTGWEDVRWKHEVFTRHLDGLLFLSGDQTAEFLFLLLCLMLGDGQFLTP